MSYRRTNDASPLEVAPSTAGATSHRDHDRPRKSECPAAIPGTPLICEKWPHSSDPTSMHWDQAAGIWWQTDEEHRRMVAVQRAFGESNVISAH